MYIRLNRNKIVLTGVHQSARNCMLNNNHAHSRIQCFLLTLYSLLCCLLLSAEHCSSHLIVVSGMIFIQQLHQCLGLVNAGRNSLLVLIPCGAILLYINV